MSSPRSERAAVPGGYPPGAEPFLAAVVAQPDDDTPRLVFADWLQENGDEDRAGFIRAQIELHRGAGVTGEASELDRRQRDALGRHRTAWLAGYPRWAVSSLWQSFRRGFPTAVQARPSDWLRYGEQLRRWLPLEEVVFELECRDYAGLLSSETLVGLKRLTLRWVGDAELHALGASAILTTLEELQVTGRQATRGRPPVPELAALRSAFGSEKLAAVRRLRIWFPRRGDALGTVIGASPHLRNLQSLHLSDGMSDDGVRALFGPSSVVNVTNLELSSNLIGDAGVRSLVDARQLTRLTELNLRFADLTDESCQLLAGWPGLRTVAVLDLVGNRFGVDGLRALSESPHLCELRHLVLNSLSSREHDLVSAFPGFAGVKLR